MTRVGGGRLGARVRGSIRAKLLLSYLLVVAVGALTVILAVLLSGPAFFDRAMRRLGDLPGLAGMAEAARADLTAAFIDAMFRAVAVASGVATLAAVLTAIVVSRRLTTPIRDLARASARLAAGRYGERVGTADEDELGALARGFNALAATLEQTERQRLTLIGDVAHELRTPLATIQGAMEGLLDEVVAPTPALWAQLHGEAGRLRRLVDDLQELSRAEAGALPLQPVALDARALLARAADRMRPHFAAADVALALDGTDGLPPVLADADRTLQVLLNLLGNALRHTPVGGTVTLGVRALDRRIILTVADTGGGIAPEDLPHLFERFYRADRSRSRASGGSGIGLTIARALVEAQGGTIRIESPGPGRGATACVTLPQARPDLDRILTPRRTDP